MLVGRGPPWVNWGQRSKVWALEQPSFSKPSNRQYGTSGEQIGKFKLQAILPGRHKRTAFSATSAIFGSSTKNLLQPDAQTHRLRMGSPVDLGSSLTRKSQAVTVVAIVRPLTRGQEVSNRSTAGDSEPKFGRKPMIYVYLDDSAECCQKRRL